MVKNVPKAMSPWLGEVLPPVWGTLTSSATKYVSEVVNLGDGDDEAEELVDSDGEVIGFENLVNVCQTNFQLRIANSSFFVYRVSQQVSDLGWIDFDLDVPLIMPSC